jgi:hypothetical protein
LSRIAELEIYKTTYILTREVRGVRAKMPKEHKYDLGEMMMTSMLRVLRGVIVAARAGDEAGRKLVLHEVLTECEVMWTWLRLGQDVRAMSIGEFRMLSERLDDLTQQAAAWYKWRGGKRKADES